MICFLCFCIFMDEKHVFPCIFQRSHRIVISEIHVCLLEHTEKYIFDVFCILYVYFCICIFWSVERLIREKTFTQPSYCQYKSIHVFFYNFFVSELFFFVSPLTKIVFTRSNLYVCPCVSKVTLGSFEGQGHNMGSFFPFIFIAKTGLWFFFSFL